MKGTILILAILAMAGGGYANEDESSLTFISGGPVYIGDIPAGTGVDVELLDEAYTLPFDNREIDAPEWMKVAPESWKHETLNTTQIIDLLTRCLEEFRKAHGSDGRLQAELDGFNKAIRTAEKNNLDLSLLWIEEAERISKQLKLRHDIEAALRALR